MAFSYTRDVGDGVKTIFTLSFAGQDNGYIATDNVHVYVNEVEVPFTINPSDPNKVYLATAPAAGAEVLIRRQMPQSLPYSDFKNGQPFSQDTLNRSFLQQLYLTQELLDGFLPDGFYYKQDVNMNGFRITNLGDAIDDYDAINKKVTDSHLIRIEGLESALVDKDLLMVPWKFKAIGGETLIVPPYTFTQAYLHINGITQTMGADYAYTVSDSKVYLAEPLQPGDEVFVLVGTGYPAPSDIINQDTATLIAASLQIGIPVNQIYFAVVGLEVTNALAFIHNGEIAIMPSPATGTVTSVSWPDITIS